MNNSQKEQIKIEMLKYEPDQFKLYCDEAGWEKWMEEYTESKDGEEVSESECKEIENVQRKLWVEVHG